MRIRSRLLLAALVSSLLLSFSVASATAGRLSVSSRSFTIVWTSLTKSTTGGVGPIRCPVTLSGSYHSATFAKVIGVLIGYTNRASVAGPSCTGGRVTINQESLPWHVQYEGFRGTLPNIPEFDVGLVRAKLTIDSGGIVCTAQSTAANPWIFLWNLSSGRATSVTPDRTATIPLRGAFLCGFAGNSTIEGTSSSVTASTITLI